jgi:uncharacterized protein
VTNLQLRIVPGSFAVAQLAAAADVPTWAYGRDFFTISRTDEELSIVCLSERVPSDVTVEHGWACLQLVGPFEFTLTGILLAVLRPLAEANVGIFAISTFNTDYVLVKHDHLSTAVQALHDAGHVVTGVD